MKAIQANRLYVSLTVASLYLGSFSHAMAHSETNSEASTSIAVETKSEKKSPQDRIVEFPNETIKFVNPKSRQGKVGQNSAGFVVIENPSETSRTLTRASSPVAKTVELHESIDDNGIHRMRPVPSIAVPAQGRVELKSGGYHIMLIGLNQDMKKGDFVPVTLEFDEGTILETTFEVTGCCGSCHGQKKKTPSEKN